MNPEARHRGHVCLEWGLVLAFVTLFVWKGLVPAWKELNTDFPNYLLAARLVRRGIALERAYDWTWFQRQKDHAGIDWGIVGYVPLSPFSALVLVPLAGLAPLVAKEAWLVINLGLLGGTMAFLKATTALPLRRLALLMFVTVVPLATSFQFGQQHVLVLFLLSVAAWLYLRDRGLASGAVLAVAAALKLYPALFGLFFLVKRRWNALAALVVTGASLLAMGIPLFGIDTLRVYITEVLPRSLAGEGNDPYYAGFNTPAVLLRRLFIREPDLNPHPLVHWPGAYVFLQPTFAAALLVSGLWLVTPTYRRGHAREGLEWGAFTALLLVLSTSSSTYHFCALILATVLAADFLVRAGRSDTAALLVGLHVLISLPLYRLVPQAPSGWSIFLGFPRLYALLGYWGVVLSVLARIDGPAARPRRTAAVFAVAFALLTWTGIRGAARHYEGQLDPPGVRLPLPPESWVASAPAPAHDDVYVSRMAEEGYVLDRTGHPLPHATIRGADVFHPAVASVRGVGWAEVASAASRVVRFELEAPLVDTGREASVVDGEAPFVSRDGLWLGFLRERRDATGELWVIDRGRGLDAVRMTEEGYDVREASFFPDGRIVMAASHEHRLSLFVLDTGRAEPLLTEDRVARYPAVSPDGAWLAYSGREGSAWQLRVMSLRTREERRITGADCNAVSPAWTEDGGSLVYASDCGRNLGNTALYRVRLSL